MDVERLIKLGAQMSLGGESLRNWVDDQLRQEEARVALAREEARLQREHEKEQRELEKEQREHEKEKRERERDAAKEQNEMEKEKWERQSALIEREIELQRLRAQSSDGPSPRVVDNRPTSLGKSPRLPSLDDKRDDVASYISRFERHAKASGWHESDWATHLGALLSGKALEVYSRMDEADAKDFKKLRDALLSRYNLTEDGFASRFRSSRPESGERMGQFRTRISGYLDKWIELAGKSKTEATDLIDLILKEQLVSACGKDLQVFIKERKPPTTDKLVELVENYVEAHGTLNAYSKSLPIPSRHGRDAPPVWKVGKEDASSKMAEKGSVGVSASTDKWLKCHRCSKHGHIARDCKTKPHQLSVMKADIPTCSYCKRRGHTVENCWKRRDHNTHSLATLTTEQESNSHASLELKCGCTVPVVSAVCTANGKHEFAGMPVATGYLDGKRVTVLRDSGCSCVVVRKGLLSPTKRRDQKVAVSLADGRVVAATVVDALVECPYFEGQVSAMELDNALYDVIIGNIPGAKCPGMSVREVNAVETRDMAKRKSPKPLSTPIASDINVTATEFGEKQKNDETLAKCISLARTGEVRQTGRSNETWFGFEDGVLIRYFKSKGINHGDVMKQLVVPIDLRPIVMKLGHESILAGHMAARKTTERVLNEFFWPSVWTDVQRFCQSCDQCQRSAPKGRTTKVPLESVPLIDEPFKRVAIDIIGPIIPASEKGNRYILTVVDYCTRYPEAVPMKSIATETVAEALVDIFSRIGVPREFLTDRGTQFTSELMAEVCRLLSVKQLTTSPYHPQCNGLVERFNGTLKSMLKKLTSEREKDWDRYINAALFAYREAPQESLGFSPFELLYGRSVRGPLTILRELWSKDLEDEEVKTTYQYVVDLREKIESTLKIAQANLGSSSSRYKRHFDRKAKQRSFQIGDKVLLLLPTKRNKLQVKWQGPFTVIKTVGANDYTVDVGGDQRTYHINLLKRYFERETLETVGVLQCAVAAVVDEDEGDDEGSKVSIVMPLSKQTETIRDVIIGESLNADQRKQLGDMLERFADVLTDVPGRTNEYKYDLRLTTDTPVRKKPYPVPQAVKQTLKEEVTSMLESGIIEPSESSYCSPSVVVRKKDGSNRYCVDYRALNNVTVFDAEPMPRLDDLFQQIGPESNFLTKIDLSKGYWQIPLAPKTKPMTAFATELGLMQFTVLPFGLQGAPAAFSRLMRKVLKGLPNVKNYIDDILVHHANWKDHLACIESVLERLRKANLTARPTKCFFGLPEVEFLGHKLGSGKIAPTSEKVEAIKGADPPNNKKQLRSFLGLASFYRRYVPNFSAVASPLTDATRNGMPNRITWDEPQRRAFDHIKKVLISEPVLQLPDYSKPFILSTDASDTGVGCIMSQEYGDEKLPVIYLSRKLLPREQRYSVVERECLALVWAIQKLSTYLVGREFVIETDHAPLLYLNRAKSENGRLMRWALLLSQYRFTLRAVKGIDNHGPDFLSRK